MEAGASCVGAASGVGTDSCSGLGSGWYSMAGLGESVIRPYQGRECVDGCFSAGITLSAIKIQINWQAVLGSILKMVLMPAVILIMGLVFKMDPLNLKMLVVAAALPPAFSGIIIADEYDTYVATGTSSLTLSVILFVGFCPLWIWITDMCLTHF